MAVLISVAFGLVAFGAGGMVITAAFIAVSGIAPGLLLGVVESLLQLALLAATFIGSRRVYRHLRQSAVWRLPPRPPVVPRQLTLGLAGGLSPFVVAVVVGVVTHSLLAAMVTGTALIGAVVVLGTPVLLLRWVRQMRQP